MANKMTTGLVVIGAGPGGYAAAFQASTLGLEVTLVDPKENPGGVCLFHGCIPTKALLHFAETKEEALRAEAWGLHFGKPTVDLDKVRDWKDGVVKKLTGGLGQLAKSRKVGFIRGKATFTGANEIRVQKHDGGEMHLTFTNAIIATGARAAELPGTPFDHERILNAESALKLDDVPEKLLVVGAGYIGLEMSVIYQSLGSAISLVELTPSILPGVDRDLAGVFMKERKDLMEKASFETRVRGVKPLKNSVEAELEDKNGEKRKEKFGKMLVAIGEKPNTEDLGLEKAGVKTDDRHFIPVDAFRRTNVGHIYAIGDVTGPPLLAHKATHEGRVAAEHIAGQKTAYEPKAIPAIIFTEPEIAWTGLTETQAKEQGREVKTAVFPWSASGRATTLDRSAGITKLIIDPANDRILGAGMAGKNAGSLIPEATLAIEMAAVARDLELTIHPHPTLSETIMEAAEIYFGEPTHVFRRKK